MILDALLGLAAVAGWAAVVVARRHIRRQRHELAARSNAMHGAITRAEVAEREIARHHAVRSEAGRKGAATRASRKAAGPGEAA